MAYRVLMDVRRWLSVLPALALMGASGAAMAQTSPDDMARRHFESGVAYLQESDYENALKAFEKAYELSSRPAILLNIATVHERQGNLQAAIDSLKKYLEQEPDGEHAKTVELRITNLEKRLQEAPPPEAEPEPKPAPAPPPRAAPPTPAPAPPPPVAPPEEESASVLPFVFLGVGAASAAGAVVTGLMANGEYDDAKASCAYSCTDDELSDGRTLALVSTVLTGVSVVSVGVGVVLLVTGNERTQERPVARGVPYLDVTASPTAAHAHATWRF